MVKGRSKVSFAFTLKYLSSIYRFGGERDDQNRIEILYITIDTKQ